MAVQMKTIKEKMGTIANIKKVTKAMEMVSTSKMKKVIRKRNESLPFAEEARKVLIYLHSFHNLDHFLFHEGKGEKTLVLIVSSNKGLCGSYNANIDKEFRKFLEDKDKSLVEIVGVGKEAQKISSRYGVPIIASFEDLSEIYDPEEVQSIFTFLLDAFKSGEYKKISIIYTEFINSLSFQTRTRSLIPLDPREFQNPEEEKKNIEYIFEPNKEEVFRYAVDYILLTVLYQYLLESLASEHSARVIAMKNASDSAEDILSELVISFNRARQSAITQEIAEIVGALSALSS